MRDPDNWKLTSAADDAEDRERREQYDRDPWEDEHEYDTRTED